MTTLVTGATGTVGGALTRALLAAGVTVRAMSRDAGSATSRLPVEVEVRQGSFDNPDSLDHALDGVDQMYLFADASTVDTVIEAAQRSRLRRIVVLTSAKDERNGSNIVAEAVKNSGLEWTVIEPGPFAMNARDWWAESIRHAGHVQWVYPEAALNPIHEADVADAATAALTTDDHIGREYYLTGPESLTQAEQVRSIGKQLGQEIAFHEVAPEDGHRVLTTNGVPDHIASWVIWILGIAAEHGGQDVSRTVTQVTGQPARTFDQWVDDHIDEFRA
ncbi:NAD(P)H-binding protein [Salinifilum ghardaiensis]